MLTEWLALFFPCRWLSIAGIYEHFTAACAPHRTGKSHYGCGIWSKDSRSRVIGCGRIETLSWDNFNEGTLFIESVERYKERFECYPEVVLVDKLYRNSGNLAFCKVRNNIRMLSRPKRDPSEDRRVERTDSVVRNGIAP